MDQAVVGMLVLTALVALAAYWHFAGGHRGELIQIDRATPLEARYVVDLNQAEWPELAQLPGVGEILARRIVASREADGAFLDHSELLRVDGIGQLTLERISPYLLPLPGGSDVAGSPAKPTLIAP
jgi:competence protein ComEA